MHNPEVASGDGGFCMVLPADEIKPGLCSLRVRFCIIKDDCQSVDLKLINDDAGHYIKAISAYYEMMFK